MTDREAAGINRYDFTACRVLGARHSSQNRHVTPHAHEYYELNYLARGTAGMRIYDEVIDYRTNDFLLIPPHTHHILHDDRFEAYDNYVILFESGGKGVSSQAVVRLRDPEGAVQFLCTEIYRNFSYSGIQRQELLDLYLKAVLYYMGEGEVIPVGSREQRREDWTGQAVRYIQEYLCREQLTVEMLANRFGVTPEHFSHALKQRLGKPPIQYINELKINEAKRLLLTEKISIKEIAARLHYSDQFYFSKQFRKMVGCSPNEYRSR